MIHFVGAGPGATDLITVRGARLLASADVVIFAGSLVNPELLDLCGPACEVHDSSRMALDEMVELMRVANAEGKEVVRLHTGDPALYGAIGEQMEELDRLGIPYEVVPGVSSLFGAAAALKAEYTVPGGSQSLVVTRVEGRTPVPSSERLAQLAAHGSTVALFLSAGLLEKAQEELLAAGRDASEPAAIVYRATWPDEAVFRCTVGTLAQCARDNDVRATALVLVGSFLERASGRSCLYDAGFSHGYRRARGAEGTR